MSSPSVVENVSPPLSGGGNLFFHGIPAPLETRPVFVPPRPVVKDARDARECGEFLDRLFQMAGLAARRYRGPALLRRVKACLRALGVSDPAAALVRLERHPRLVPVAVDAVLLGVTEFFRDQAVFEVLERRVLPDLLAARTGASAPLSVWSAACSDGRELYSVAMLLEEAGALENSRLLGTDCRAEAVRQAAEGGFAAAALESLPEARRKRHFTESPGGIFRLSARLRGVLEWRPADLLQETAPGPWDMILWRNMAIYLKSCAAESVWLALYRELRPGGWLITGRAEQPPRHLSLARLAPCVYRKSDSPEIFS